MQRNAAGAAEYIPGVASIDNLSRGDFGGAVGDIPGSFFNLMDAPLTGVKFGTGALIGGINEGLGALDRAGVPGAGFAFEPETSRAFQQGGPMAAWEQVRSEEPLPFQLLTEIGLDPLTAFGLPGKAPDAVKAFEEAAMAPGIRGAVSGAAADFTRGADLVFNQAPWEVTKRVIDNPLTRPVARVGKAGINKVIPNAFELSEKSKLGRKLTDIASARKNQLSGRNGLPGLPAVIPGVTKSLSPFEEYDVPPFFDGGMDEGIPRRVKELAWESWQALRMSQPGIPGINAPGINQSPEGPLRMMKQRPADTGMLGRIRGQFQRDEPLGFINIPRGGYKDPYDVRLDEDNLRHMANIGAAIMLDYDNDASNRLFGRLMQANSGYRDVKKALAEEYGSGIEPFIPGVIPEMRRQVESAGGSMPSERFAAPWGWPEGEVPTQRLEEIQAKLDSGTITREEALAQIESTGFHFASPQITETAAGFGAGQMAATRAMDTPEAAQALYNPYTGSMRPNQIDPTTNRAAVPGEFTSQFDKNRVAYDTYMTQLFGQMPADELDTLRRMSTEVLYGEMLNAAAPHTGGSFPATAFLEGRAKESESTRKLGGYADPDDPRQVGNRLDEIESLGDAVRYSVGRPTLKSLNTAELKKFGYLPTKKDYEKVMGTYPKGGDRTLNNAQVIQMIEKLGGKPFMANRVGGPLPNAQRLVELFQVGKDLPLGDFPAAGFYDEAAREILNIVGPGRYEDAAMLIDLLGITSSSEGVEKNAQNAIRLFAEWKVGSPDFSNRLMQDFGLTSEEVQRLLTQNGEWSDPHQIFRKGIKEGMRDLTTRAFNEYVARRETSESWQAIQGGPKTHNYAGSVLLNVWRDAVDYALRSDPTLHKTFREGLDKAAKALAWDRHMSRVTEHGTEVTEMQAIAMRELGLIASEMAGASPERFQSGLWYLIKDQQGFTRINREDDVAHALRKAWTENLDPDKMAEVQLLLDEKYPNLRVERPDQFQRMAEDIWIQEAMYGIIERHLTAKEDDLARVAGERKPLSALFNLTDDVVGIVNRANRGVPPQRKPNVLRDVHGPGLVDLAGNMLRSIKQGQDFGATFSWDGTGWTTELPPSGYAVALTSAGQSVSTSKIKTFQKEVANLLNRYTDTLEDPRYADKIKFGLFDMTDDGSGSAASFDMTLIVPDLRQATDLAKRFNQKSIYNLGAGELIQTGGSGEPVKLTQQELRNIIDSIYGKQSVQKPDIREAFRRGATLDELNAVNPVSIMNRRVLGPIMERFHTESVKSLASDLPEGSLELPGDTIGLPGPVPDDVVFNFDQIGQDPFISTQENVILNQTLGDGEKIGQRLDRYLDEARRDVDIVEQSPIKWKATASAADRLKLVQGDAEMKRIVEKYNKLGIDIGYARPEDIEMARLRRDMAGEAGIEPDRETRWDLFRAAWGEQALFSPRYHTGNIQGAWLQNAFGGTFAMPGPDQFIAAFKYARAGRDDITRQEAMRNLHVFHTFQKWGFDEIPNWLTKGGARAWTGSGKRSAAGRLVGQVTKNESLGTKAGLPFDFNADVSESVELVMRGTLAEDVMEREMVRQMPAFEAAVNRMAAKQGLADFEFSILNTINPVPGGPSPRRLKDHLMRMGFTDGYAERAGRSFAEAKNKAENLAKAEVEKRQFSYDRTNLDEFASKFVPFLYWYSRALRYFGEESLRHPIVLLNYMRAQQGIEDAQNNPGLSARQKGFLKLMGTPLGFTLLMNPEAMFGVVKVFGLDSYENPEDTELSVGKVLNFAKERGLGLYPWLEGTLNLMGVMGDTYEPDLLGIRHKALIGSVVNFMRSQLGVEPMGSPYMQAMGQMRGNISGFVSQFTPDWLTQSVQPKAGGSLADASMDTVIESRILARNPNLTNGELLDIMADPDSPEYEAAYQDAASAGLIQQLLNFTLPQTYRMREDTRDVRSAQISTIYEAAQKQGVSPYEFKPTVADNAFAARYEQLTGKQWQPGDYSDAKTKQDLVRATPSAKPLAYQSAEYHNLGTSEQQRRFSKYQDILNGVNPQTAALEYPQRRELANAWASRMGYTDDIAEVYRLREAWEQSHPEFKQYQGWADQMRQLKAQLGGTLAEYRRQASQQNPNAAKYFADTERWVQATFAPEEWGEKLDEYTVSSDAFTAINGMTQSRFDQAPMPGVPPVDVTLPGMMQQAYSSQPTQSHDWLSSLRNVSQGFGVNTYGTWWNS